MKKIKFLVIVLALLAGSCASKNDATLRITNVSGNPYSISINGNSKGILSGGSFEEYKLSAGSYSVTWVQLSGYVFYPTTGETSVIVTEKEEREILIP